MDVFLKAFFTIDTDFSEEITISELETYMKENNLKNVFIDKWINIFDQNKDGVISLEEYCSVLGLIVVDARIMREQFQLENSSPGKGLPSDVEIIFSNISKELEIEIVDLEMEATNNLTSTKEVSQYIKQELDKYHEESWHCIIILGQYSSYCSALPSSAFHYKRGKYIYVIWKTVK